jgi:hypothetical protein
VVRAFDLFGEANPKCRRAKLLAIDKKSPILKSVKEHWCERGDSNPHGFTRQILSSTRTKNQYFSVVWMCLHSLVKMRVSTLARHRHPNASNPPLGTILGTVRGPKTADGGGSSALLMQTAN